MVHGCPVSHLDSKTLKVGTKTVLCCILIAPRRRLSFNIWIIHVSFILLYSCSEGVCLGILGVDSGKEVFSILSHDSSLSSLSPSLFSYASLWLPPFPLPAVPSLSSVLPPVSVCFPVCVEVPSETEAVQGNPMKLRCISCMKREEVEATTVVEWFYRPEGGKDFLIYEYRNGHQEVESPFQGRLQWNGSKDLQDVSITVLNVTLNDSGLYTCNVSREFEFEAHRPFVKTTRLIPLRVTEEAGEDFTSVVSEIMMYILLVFLTLWLLIEMIYCYRKVSKAEEAAQENA
ncbi:Sodium channel subunit beta-3 [Sciurus carolinensis]|uniref:Sodium channel regulatory subunit beta-3 n=1 Tax=Sciurus carolinensis TaxID=30640 RepID=A0AA41T683_SCICA|nr:Sodium channel subunit beta-3 [Sciurus carolinensis]